MKGPDNPFRALGFLRHGIMSAAFSPDGKKVVTASFDTTARVWEWEVSGDQFVELKGHGGPLDFAAFSPDGSRVVTASKDWSARVWETATGRLVAEMDGHSH